MDLRFSLSKQRFLFLVGITVIYSAVFMGMDSLQGPLWRDERHFWEATLHFSHRLIPTLEDLRTYEALNTPLPFMTFGILENLFHQGVFASRLFNLLLSLVIVFLIGWPHQTNQGRAIPCVVGLLIYPYFLTFSGRLFTDTIACFWVMMGLLAYIRNRHLLSSLAFILAIASRQYMVAFPAAIATYEFLLWAADTWRFRTLNLTKQHRWLLPAIATLSILIWFWLFQGIAPETALEIRETPAVQKTTWALNMGGINNFLAIVGLYMVIPEFVLLQRWQQLDTLKKAIPTLRTAAIAAGLLLFFCFFPPILDAGGLLIQLKRLVPAPVTIAAFYGLSLLACLRFGKLNLLGLFILCNSLIMIKAYPWPDKYVFQLLAVFWYLKSIGLDHEFSFSHILKPVPLGANQ